MASGARIELGWDDAYRGEGSMCLGEGSRLGVPVDAFASLLMRELGIIERATCASGTGAVWVCQSAPSLSAFAGIGGF
jgi:hypothetical protein